MLFTRRSDARSASIDRCVNNRNNCGTSVSCNPRSRARASFRASFAPLRGWFDVLSIGVRHTLSRRHVNTSLSGHCFF